MFINDKIWIGRGDEDCFLLPNMANRHGLICGASGTGKTITLKVLAESFSAMGVPVFLADIKGDLSGMCQSGEMTESLAKRVAKFGFTDGFPFQSFPTCFWDVYGEKGHPVRTTISEMGPSLLSRLMALSDVQDSVLASIFNIADDHGLELIDMKDLKAMVQHVAANVKDYISEYGNMSTQSLGALLRNINVLDSEGGNIFFGEPAIEIEDWMKYDVSGQGYINILDCTELFHHPTLYATFMLWLLDELFEKLPEVGDPEKPKLVFFFDEAHLLFRDMPKALLAKIEQLVKLIRSKGVGIYFITQNPMDVPDCVLAQLSNRIEHALRAYTPKEQKAVRVAAETFRANPLFNTADAISELGTGEALISCLDEKGIPSIVQRAKVLCPQSTMGECDPSLRAQVLDDSEMGPKYNESVDNYSAYEALQQLQEDSERISEQQEILKQYNDQAKALQKQYDSQAAALQKQVNNLAAKAGVNVTPVQAPEMIQVTLSPEETVGMTTEEILQYQKLLQRKAVLQQQRLQQFYAQQQVVLQQQKQYLQQQLDQQKLMAQQAAQLEKERQQALKRAAAEQRKQEEAWRKMQQTGYGRTTSGRTSTRQTSTEKILTNTINGLGSSFGREMGRSIARTLLGTAPKKRR